MNSKLATMAITNPLQGGKGAQGPPNDPQTLGGGGAHTHMTIQYHDTA